MAASAPKLAAKPKNKGEDCLAQVSIPAMLDPPPLRPHASSPAPEASASTFSCESMPQAVDPPPNHHLEFGPHCLVLDSDDEDVDEALVDSPPLLTRPRGRSCAHPPSPALNASLLQRTPSSCYNSNHRCSSSMSDLLHDSMATPPPPPPLNQRRPQPDDDLIVPPTPESELRTSPTYADIVKRSSSGKNHHQQPQGHKLKSIYIDPSRREVHPRRAGLRVRFADSPHLSRSAMQSSCSTSSAINSSWNTSRTKVGCPQEELHPSPTHGSSNDRSTSHLSPRIRMITKGRCFICLAQGHWAAACRGPITCFRCRRSGHRERDCRQHLPLQHGPQPPPREDESSGHQNVCRTERLQPRSDESVLKHFFTEHANFFQHEFKKMLDAKIQSLWSEFSSLISAQLRNLQESNEKWMKLAEKLAFQTSAMPEADMQAHDDRLNQLAPLQPKHLGDQFHKTKESAPSGSLVEGAITFKSKEVTIQDVEDALLQIENAATKEPPLSFASCCSPTHAAGGEFESLLLPLTSANDEPSQSHPAIQPEEQTVGSPPQVLGLATVEPTASTLKVASSSHAVACHQLEDIELTKATSEATLRLTSRRCRFRQGCVYTRRPRCGSGRTRHGFGSAVDAMPHMDTHGQGHTTPPLLEDGGQAGHEVALANFIHSITKPVQQPLLPPKQHGPVKPRREKKRPSKPSRCSARLAAIAWPRGDAQSRARQVLMKRLGVAQEEGDTREMTLQRYVNLFRGPMSDLVIKSLVQLSGLDGPAMLGQIVT